MNLRIIRKFSSVSDRGRRTRQIVTWPRRLYRVMSCLWLFRFIISAHVLTIYENKSKWMYFKNVFIFVKQGWKYYYPLEIVCVLCVFPHISLAHTILTFGCDSKGSSTSWYPPLLKKYFYGNEWFKNSKMTFMVLRCIPSDSGYSLICFRTL